MLGGEQKSLLYEYFLIFFTLYLKKKIEENNHSSSALKAAHICVCSLLECLSTLPKEHVPSLSPHGEWQNLPYGGHLVQVHK